MTDVAATGRFKTFAFFIGLCYKQNIFSAGYKTIPFSLSIGYLAQYLVHGFATC